MSKVNLSSKSLKALASVKPALQHVCHEMFETIPFDVIILEGVRTLDRQKQLVAEGKSKTMKSKHLVAEAVDIAPYPVDWNDLNRFQILAEHMTAAANKLNIPIRWGGTWTGNASDKKASFYDGPHFELV